MADQSVEPFSRRALVTVGGGALVSALAANQVQARISPDRAAIDAALVEMHDMASQSPEAPSILNKLNRDGSNVEDGQALRTAIGADLAEHVHFSPLGTGAVVRSIQDKARDVLSFADAGARGDDLTDDTAALKSAIVNAATLVSPGAGRIRLNGVPGKTYRITSAIPLASGVDIDLNGSTVKQYAANTPIFIAPPSPIVEWGLRNGRLEFNIQQTSRQTGSVGLLLANGHLSYLFSVENLDVVGACRGIVCPDTVGSYAFLGKFESVRVLNASSWSWTIRCDRTKGANTNLTFSNCWAAQTSGSELPDSKGFEFFSVSQGQWVSICCDHIQNECFSFTGCSGKWGALSVESCDFTGPVIPVLMSDSPGMIDSLKFIDNRYDSTRGDIYMLRPCCTSTGYLQVLGYVEEGGVFTGGATYEVNPSVGMRIANEFAILSRAPNLADHGIRKKIVRWNGVDQMRSHAAGQVTVYGRSAPASEAWIVGDMCINTMPEAGGPPGWVCTRAGTPGTWKAMASLAT